MTITDAGRRLGNGQGLSHSQTCIGQPSSGEWIAVPKMSAFFLVRASVRRHNNQFDCGVRVCSSNFLCSSRVIANTRAKTITMPATPAMKSSGIGGRVKGGVCGENAMAATMPRSALRPQNRMITTASATYLQTIIILCVREVDIGAPDWVGLLVTVFLVVSATLPD